MSRYGIDPLVDRDCVMLDGMCKCLSIYQCKYTKDVEKYEKRQLARKEAKKQVRKANIQSIKEG